MLTGSFARSLAATLLVAMATPGCGTGARIRTRDGAVFHAHIEGSPGPTVHVVRDGRQYEIPREQIEDVSHPGTATMIVGAGLIGLGTLLLVASSHLPCNHDDAKANCNEQRSMDETVGRIWFVMFAAPGVGIGTWGTVTHLGSRGRYSESWTDPTAPR